MPDPRGREHAAPALAHIQPGRQPASTEPAADAQSLARLPNFAQLGDGNRSVYADHQRLSKPSDAPVPECGKTVGALTVPQEAASSRGTEVRKGVSVATPTWCSVDEKKLLPMDFVELTRPNGRLRRVVVI